MAVLSEEKTQTVAFALMSLFYRDQQEDIKNNDEKIGTDHIASIASDLGIPAKIMAGAYFVENCVALSQGDSITDAFHADLQKEFGDEYATEFITQVSFLLSRTQEGIRGRQ